MAKANRLYLVTLQKQVPGKSYPKEADSIRHRRVVAVLAPDGATAGRLAQSLGAYPVVNAVELISGVFVVAP